MKWWWMVVDDTWYLGDDTTLPVGRGVPAALQAVPQTKHRVVDAPLPAPA
eukprot:CAMPEP_0197579798 /NCGR_PEP_ID=MMETSP1326-20131121/3725_1 /TAXON_ID=1155430 /ORGANISM="Genus nov. species nov., Strain RCC2288" /LENGTH=49 /DNA_ID= /DNA_START= /DNA_END= /DNA_ORIENTATION=